MVYSDGLMFSALLVFWDCNSMVYYRTVTRCVDVFLVVILKKLLKKQPICTGHFFTMTPLRLRWNGWSCMHIIEFPKIDAWGVVNGDEYLSTEWHVTRYHYNGVIMSAMASQIASITIVYSTVYSAQINENIKAPRHWPLWVEFTGDRWIPRTKGQ